MQTLSRVNYTCMYPNERNLKSVPTGMSYANDGTRTCSCDRKAFSGLTEVCRAVQFNTGNIAEVINWVTVGSTFNALENLACKALRSWGPDPAKHLGY